jgi:hypothetical protein
MGVRQRLQYAGAANGTASQLREPREAAVGWSVHHKTVISGALEAADRACLHDWAERWTERLTHGCEYIRWQELDEDDAAQIFAEYAPDGTLIPFAPVPGATYLWGFTKVQYSQDPEADFCTLIAALKELAAAQPSWRITVSDDYHLRDADPAAIDDPRALLDGSGDG